MKAKKKSTRIIIILLVVLVVLAIIATVIGVKKLRSASSMAGTAETLVQPLEEQDLSTSINTSGKVESQHVVSVTTEITTKIKTLNVALGDYVEVGQTLCTFDDTEIREQIQELESQVSTSEQMAANQVRIAQRNLQQAIESRNNELGNAAAAIRAAKDAKSAAESRVQEAKAEVDRLKKEEPEKQDALKEAKDTLSAATQAVAAASTGVKEAEKAYAVTDKTTAEAVQAAQDQVDTNAISAKQGGGDNSAAKSLSKLYRQLDNVTVKAEQAGIITALNVSQGSIPNGTMMQIEDQKNLKVTVKIQEKDIVKVKEGMNAVITADALPDETNRGKISKVINFATSQAETGSPGQRGDSQSGGASYSAEIKVDPGSKLLLGMTAKVEIILDNTGKVLAVPYDAIMVDENENSYVFRAVESKDDMYLIERVDVTPGTAGDYYIAIESGELKKGDYIVMMPGEVIEGAEVKISVADNGMMDMATDGAQVEEAP